MRIVTDSQVVVMADSPILVTKRVSVQTGRYEPTEIMRSIQKKKKVYKPFRIQLATYKKEKRYEIGAIEGITYEDGIEVIQVSYVNFHNEDENRFYTKDSLLLDISEDFLEHLKAGWIKRVNSEQKQLKELLQQKEQEAQQQVKGKMGSVL